MRFFGLLSFTIFISSSKSNHEPCQQLTSYSLLPHIPFVILRHHIIPYSSLFLIIAMHHSSPIPFHFYIISSSAFLMSHFISYPVYPFHSSCHILYILFIPYYSNCITFMTCITSPMSLLSFKIIFILFCPTLHIIFHIHHQLFCTLSLMYPLLILTHMFQMTCS